MDVILYVIGFSFSFFFILLSFWKEDKQLNIIGSISLIIIALILIGTSIQSTENSLDYIQFVSNATGNYSDYYYTSEVYTHGIFYENIGIGTLITIFSALQYLYFSIAYKFAAKREDIV